MDDLVQFLRARLAEDEQAAQAVAQLDPAPWSATVTSGTPERFFREPGSPGAGMVSNAASAELWDCEGSDRLCMTAPASVHIARHDPVRVLAEVEAKRQIIDLHAPFHVEGDPITGCATCSWRDEMDDLQVEWPCATLRLLALPYADPPDYRPEWRPGV